MFCKKCGGKLETYAKNCAFCGTPTKEDFGVVYDTNRSSSHTSVTKWFFLPLLMMIPIVNIVLLLVWAFGEDKKSDPTFRNWARAQLLMILIGVGIVIFLTAFSVINLNEISNSFL